MTKLAAPTALAMLAASAAFGQIIDPLTGNMTTMEPTIEPPAVLAPVCELRRMEFDDGFGVRVRDVRVCCVQERCTYQLAD